MIAFGAFTAALRDGSAAGASTFATPGKNEPNVDRSGATAGAGLAAFASFSTRRSSFKDRKKPRSAAASYFRASVASRDGVEHGQACRLDPHPLAIGVGPTFLFGPLGVEIGLGLADSNGQRRRLVRNATVHPDGHQRHPTDQRPAEIARRLQLGLVAPLQPIHLGRVLDRDDDASRPSSHVSGHYRANRAFPRRIWGRNCGDYWRDWPGSGLRWRAWDGPRSGVGHGFRPYIQPDEVAIIPVFPKPVRFSPPDTRFFRRSTPAVREVCFRPGWPGSRGGSG